MSLSFSISPGSDIPIFRQIMQAIHHAVAVGKLQVGEQLPAVRTLAELLLINPNTVARAYQELIREGILESRSGRGVFVAEKRPVFSDLERNRRLQHSAEQLCHEAMRLDFGLPELRAMLETTWNCLQREARDIQLSLERKKK